MIDKLMAAYPDSEDLEWNRDNDNFDVLRRADLLVSDFSGVIFDFTLVFDKPVIYADTKFDKSPYDCWWLDTPYWTFEILPQIGQQLTEDNFDTLGDMVQQCLTDPKYALPASPTSPDILSGKSHIPSEMPGKKRNNPEIQTPGRRS